MKTNNANIEIGIVTMKYDQQGKVVEASFTPTMKMDFDLHLIHQLEEVHCSKEVDVVKNNAEMVLAGWFTQMNNIELADRDEYGIVSEVMNCSKHEDGMVKECSIKFTFSKIAQQVN